MIPRDRRTALLTILDAEREVKALALESYRQWLPIAREAVLGERTVTSAAQEPPPDPEALGMTQADWEAILAGVFLPGLADLLWARMAAEMAELGLTAADIARLAAEATARAGRGDGDDEDTPTQPTRRRRRRGDQDTELEPEPDSGGGGGGGGGRGGDDDPADEDDDSDDEGHGDEDKPPTPEQVAKIPEVQDWVDAYLATVNNRMVRTPDTAFRLIADELATATREGESIEQMRARVARILDAENLDTFGGRRAALVARTETCGALNAARLESARVMAEVTGEELDKAWLATIDRRTRATHFATDGQRVPIGGAFTLPSGVEMHYPGEPGAPANEVCNCRCALMLLATDEELPAEDDRQTERGPGDATVRNRAGTRAEEIKRRHDDEGITRARDDPNGTGHISAAAPPPERIRPMIRWRATLAHLGIATDDRRMLAPDIALRFRDTPMPLMWQERTAPEHGGSVAVGVVDTIELVDTRVEATGHFLNTEDAAKALVQIREGITNPSIDPGDVGWEIRNEAGETITDFDQIGPDDKLFEVYTSAIVTAATLVNIPAFGSTDITLLEDDVDEDDTDSEIDDEVILAAATAPRFRPAGPMFADPGFTEPTPLHITSDGRVQGHLAAFGICHVGISDRCVMAPRSASGYAHFQVSAVELDDSMWLPVGRLTVGAGHADHSLGARAAAEHYDNTGTCWAYVRAGEDAHGIWVSGVIHPDATESQVREGLSAPLSGDWRSIGGHLELVAALSVNTPGFPVVRGRADDRGRATTLVASLAPRHRRPAADTQLLRTVAVEAVREFRKDEARRTEVHTLIQSRRRTQATALVAAIRSRKG